MMAQSRRLAMLGVPIDAVTMEQAVAILDGYIIQHGFHQIATANLNFLTNALRERDLLTILQRCSLVLPDGTPLLWAARWMGTPLPERVTGYNLVPRLVRLAAEKDYKLFLLGASEAASSAAAEWIRKNYPAARQIARYAPPFTTLERMDHEEILQRIEHARPDILLVAFGNPKQEQWLAMHRGRLQVPVAIGVGGSLSYLAGEQSHAPRWMQQAGLESLYRVWQEPRRLAARYLADLCVSLRRLMWQVAAVRAQPRDSRPQRLSCKWQDGTRIVKPVGAFQGHIVWECEACIESMGEIGVPVIFDLSAVCSIGPDALGMLIGLDLRVRNSGGALSLVGVTRPVRRVLAASLLADRLSNTSALPGQRNCD